MQRLGYLDSILLIQPCPVNQVTDRFLTGSRNAGCNLDLLKRSLANYITASEFIVFATA
jgi:hypothetical protein